MKISVIVPVYHEADRINALLDDLDAAGAGSEYEVIVVDGAGPGDTIAAITYDHRWVAALACAKGRAKQMNAGATAARGDVLLFLHADTFLPRDAFRLIAATLRDSRVAGGAFELQLDAPGLFFKIISFTASLRSRITKVPFGDQAVFLRAEFFRKIGGFKDMPLMEDTEMMCRVKKAGGRIRIIGAAVSSSARKWQKDGLLYTTVWNHYIRLLYALGVSPAILARLYARAGRRPAD
jgi:rSAM/selenodomain-associated transferase 2